MRAYEGGGQGQGEEGMRVAQATRAHHSSRVPQLGSARYAPPRHGTAVRAQKETPVWIERQEFHEWIHFGWQQAPFPNKSAGVAIGVSQGAGCL